MDELTVTIESLSYGPFGVARTGRGVVFVPGVAPGDVARVRVVAEKRGYREAELVEIVTPSPARRTPPCRYVPECGGCTWQHVDYTAQLAAKEAIVRDALTRLGAVAADALDISPIMPSAQWAYRHRVTLRVAGEHRLGFYRHRSHRLVEIDGCSIADETVNANLPVAREWLRGASTTVRRLEIASSGPGRVVLVANAEGAFRNDDEYHEKFLRSHRTVAGIVLFGKGWRRTFGKPVVALEVDGESTIESEGGFTQVNPEGNRRLVEVVLAMATPRDDDRVLDLYCGAGNFTLPLARRAGEAVGVESDPHSVTLARRNANRWGLSNCRFMAQSARVAAEALAAAGESFSLVVLDPPRSGALEALEHLARIATDRIVYVSCDPATLARDVRQLTAFGFAVGPVQPLDLFPQTYHLESVVQLERRGHPQARARTS